MSARCARFSPFGMLKMHLAPVVKARHPLLVTGLLCDPGCPLRGDSVRKPMMPVKAGRREPRGTDHLGLSKLERPR